MRVPVFYLLLVMAAVVDGTAMGIGSSPDNPCPGFREGLDEMADSVPALSGRRPRSSPRNERPLPPVIPKTGRPPLPVEIEEVGHLAEGPDSLKNLPDGDYIFLIDDQGTVAWSNRRPFAVDPNVPGTQYLATHEALEAMLKRRRPPEGGRRILSPGQFRIRGGRARRLDDKSGRWRGGRANFEHGEDVLKSRGLPVEPGTERIEYSEMAVSEDHYKEALQVKVELLEPKLTQEIMDLEVDLARAFPDPKKTGAFDGNRMIDVLMDVAESNEEFNAATEASHLLPMAANETVGSAIIASDRRKYYTPEMIAAEEAQAAKRGKQWTPRRTDVHAMIASLRTLMARAKAKGKI